MTDKGNEYQILKCLLFLSTLVSTEFTTKVGYAPNLVTKSSAVKELHVV